MTRVRTARPTLLRVLRLALVGVTTGALLGATAVPAHADVRTFRDRRGDTGVAADVTRVRVDHGGAGGSRVVTTARVGDLSVGDVITFFVDARARSNGPEYVTRVRPNAAGPVLRRIDGWRGAGSGSVVRCPGLRARADAFGPDRVRVSIPRGCMRTPSRVRLAVLARFEYPRRTVVDWAPARRELFGPVRR